MRTFALAIAALLLTTACTDDPEPIEPKAPASPSVTPPSLPSAATSDTPEGQVAFVRYVVSVLNYSVGTGSTDELEQLFSPNCEGCGQYVSRVRSDNAGMGKVEGFEWEVTKGRVLEGDKVEISVKAAPYEKSDPKSGEPARVKAASYQLGFELGGRNGKWIVEELYVPESEK